MQIYFAKKFLDFFDYFYQKKIFKYLKKFLGENINIAIDVGAHRGETINKLNNFFKIKKIIAFEPSKENFKYLEKIKDNKYQNIEIYNLGCGNENKKTNLKFAFESSSSTISEINLNSKYFKLKKKLFLGLTNKKLFTNEEIEIIKLDDFLDSHRINEIELLKIDTEGYEFEVVKGLANKLQNIKIIYFEHHYDDMVKKKYTFRDINSFLINNNFKQIFKIKMPFRKTFEYIYINEKIN